MTILFLNLQITRSDARPHIKWAVSLVICINVATGNTHYIEPFVQFLMINSATKSHPLLRNDFCTSSPSHPLLILSSNAKLCAFMHWEPSVGRSIWFIQQSLSQLNVWWSFHENAVILTDQEVYGCTWCTLLLQHIVFLSQIRLRTEVLRTPSSNQPG